MRRSRRPLLLAAALALSTLLSLVPGVAHAERTLGLSSGSFAFEVDPGQTGEGEVIVTNDGDEPLKALVYVTDVVVDDIGHQTFVEPEREGATLLTTPASWFQVFMPEDSKAVGNTPYLEMDPGDRIPIRFSFSPPAGTPSGDHNVVIFFEMFEFAQGGEGAVAQVAGRLGARVAVRVTGDVIERLTIRPFDVPDFKIGTIVPFSFTVNNGGNTNKRVDVSADLLDRSERTVVASIVATDTAILAGARYRFEGALDTGAGRFGPHTLEVRVQYFLEGNQTPSELVEERTVWLIPTWAVLLVLFIVFDALVYGAIRSWRGRDRRSDRRAPGGVHRGSADAGDVSSGQTDVSPAFDAPEAPENASVLRRERRSSPGPAVDMTTPVKRSGDRGHRLTRRELRQEAEERRRRRAERAAEAAMLGDITRGQYPSQREDDSPTSGGADDDR